MSENIKELSKTLTEAENKYKELQGKGYHIWNSYNPDEQMQVDNATNNLKKWGYKIEKVIFPNGVTVLMYRIGK